MVATKVSEKQANHWQKKEVSMRKIALCTLLSLIALVLTVTSVSDVRAAKTVPHQISGILPGTVTFLELPFSDITDPYYQVGGLSVVSAN